MQRRSLNIGVTVGMRSPNESLWINGIKQNALYLAKVFQHSVLRHNVWLVNTTGIELGNALPWDTKQFPVCDFNDAKDRLDILIELGGQISNEQTQYLHSRGTKIVSYCCGPEYVQMIEAMIFGRRMCDHVFINQHYDAIWVIPQVMETSAGFLGTLRRLPVREVPFVWDPMCLEMRSRDLPWKGEYQPRLGPKRLSIMEPNIDVLKFCLYPMLIAETAYREIGDAIGHVHVTNAEHLARQCPEFIGIAHHLDLVKQSKVSFVGRYDTPQFLSEHTDIVLSHQWGLALNYFYFDVCWNGFALVHNAHLCAEVGYYYPGNDVDKGAQKLVQAVYHHDADFDGYRLRQRREIGRFLATNPQVAKQYDDLLFGLLETKRA